MESDLGDICNWSSEMELFLLGSSVNKEVFYFVNSLKKYVNLFLFILLSSGNLHK